MGLVKTMSVVSCINKDRKSTRLNSSHVSISYLLSFPTRRSSDLKSRLRHLWFPHHIQPDDAALEPHYSVWPRYSNDAILGLDARNETFLRYRLRRYGTCQNHVGCKLYQ